MTSKKPFAPKAPAGKKTPNPFDRKVDHVKFDILNRDRKGTRGMPAQAKQRNDAIRRATLLPELQRRGKTSSFQDRRFGERDRNMSQEEKMLERFSRERQSKAKKNVPGLVKGKKKSIFNLDEDDEYGDDSLAGLTHLGQDVDELSGEDFDLEEADEDGIDRATTRATHFGGFDEERDDAVPKTRAEIMKEVIAKSKFYKAERQKAKEANEELCDDLNESFKSLIPTLLAEENRYDRAAEAKVEDDYDAFMRQMVFDKRTKPDDRTLTADELAKKREAEAEAKEARMQGQRDKDEDESDNEDEAGVGKKKAAVNSDTEKDEQRARIVLDEFCEATAKDALTAPYKKLGAMACGPSSVALGRAIRTRLGEILVASFGSAKTTRPFFPSRQVLLLFHLIGKIYSTSDYHHVICTPASLLMAAFMEHGRMTRPKHLLSAVFLGQTLLAFHKDAKRVSPELMNLIHLLLAYFNTSSGKSSLFYDGLYNRLIEKRLAEHPSDVNEVTQLTFEDLSMENEYSPAFSQRLLSAIHALVKSTAQVYAGIPSFPEYFEPLIPLVASSPSTHALLTSLCKAAHAQRRPLALQHFKPVALPMLTPDLDQPNSAKDKETRDTARLRAAYKREFKGAKRELRRDNEFLARHEAMERKRKDEDYKNMINRVYGTIANDNAGLQPSKKSKTKH
jgi:hypothetical protein